MSYLYANLPLASPLTPTKAKAYKDLAGLAPFTSGARLPSLATSSSALVTQASLLFLEHSVHFRLRAFVLALTSVWNALAQNNTIAFFFI